MKYQVVLWDFDGTLVDSSPGLFRSLGRMFERMGRPVPGEEVLRKFIGPPIVYSLKTMERDMKNDQHLRETVSDIIKNVKA